MRNQDDFAYLKEFGKRLRQCRKGINRTQAQVAELLCMSPNNYGKVENGKQGLRVERLALLGTELGMDLNYILTGQACQSDTKDTKGIVNVVELSKMCPNDKMDALQELLKNLAKLL